MTLHYGLVNGVVGVVAVANAWTATFAPASATGISAIVGGAIANVGGFEAK